MNTQIQRVEGLSQPSVSAISGGAPTARELVLYMQLFP